MTKREAAIIEAFTGLVLLKGEDRKVFYEYAEEVFGYPIWSIEFGQKSLKKKLKEKSRADFMKLCQSITE